MSHERPKNGGQHQWIFVLVAPALLAAAAVAITRLAAETNYHEVVATLLATPAWEIATAIVLTFASFAALTFYDLNAFAALDRPKRWREIALGAFVAFAVSQTVGFGPLSGAAVRMRFYVALGVAPAVVVGLTAFITASFGLGLVALGACSALVVAPEVAAQVGLTAGEVRAISTILISLVLATVWHGGSRLNFNVLGERQLTIPSRPILLRQLAVSATDMAATAGVLWILLPADSVGYVAFLPIFVVAVALGVLSHVPAGIGIFEAVILTSLRGDAPTSDIIAALALYRLIYHALPVVIAAVAIAASEFMRLTRNPAARAVIGAFAGLAPQALAALALVLGAMLVFSGVTPASPSDLKWLATIFPIEILETAHFLASIFGTVLMIAARGLAFRLEAAWLVALVAAGLALMLSLAKALALYEAAALGLFALLLIASRGEFSRPSAFLSQTLSARWVAAIGAVMISALAVLLFAFEESEFGFESWMQFEIAAQAPRGLRALIGAALMLGVAGAWSLLRPVDLPTERPTPEDLAHAIAIVERQASADANLVRMGDKPVMFSSDGRGFIMYGRQARSWIALFDPVGPRDVWPGLVWQFLETARRSGGRAAFYEVAADTLSIYADAGLNCHKLGEEARIELGSFHLDGPERRDLRYALSRGQREGLAVEILDAQRVPAVVDVLEEISREWLSARGGGEKGFSLGAFARSYVSQQRVALLRRNGEIIAFATLMETAVKEEATIDLMRHRVQIPGISMEFLFLQLIERFRAEGYGWFSLGMAPLAGLSESDAAPAWHRIGNAIFEHGTRTYNFKGLRSFKAQFLPDWQPRYLAVAGGLSPAFVLLDAARLIRSGGEEIEE